MSTQFFKKTIDVLMVLSQRHKKMCKIELGFNFKKSLIELREMYD